jgi:hypothetical protein
MIRWEDHFRFALIEQHDVNIDLTPEAARVVE